MISYIIPVAYDYKYSYGAIRSIYGTADEILVGVDRDRLTWSKKPYEIDMDEFRSNIRKIDTREIVRIVEDDFHDEDHPMKNDTRERNILSAQCREGNWIVNLDSDERALNAMEFRDCLARQDRSIDVAAEFITVFKIFGGKCLVTARPWERCPVATTARSAFQKCRTTGRPLQLSNLKIFHFSWGRTREELVQKVANWGHAHDFDTARFLQFWDSVDLSNYTKARNFHPLYGPLWPGLMLLDLPNNLG